MQLEKKMKLKEQPKQIVKKSDIIKSKKYLFKMIGKKRTHKKIESKKDKFLLKLYENHSKEEYSNIIHWNQNGSYIIIANVQLLEKKILL